MNVQRLSPRGVGKEDIPEKVATQFYTLCCPKDGSVKYVGRSKDAKKRLVQHISEAKLGGSAPKDVWIRLLMRGNLLPKLRVIWTGDLTRDTGKAIERHLIRKYRKTTDLKNGQDRALGGTFRTSTVYQYDLNGSFITSHINALQAEIATGVKDCNISKCCKNENGYGTKTAGGFFWSFIEYKNYPHIFVANWRKLKGKPVYCIISGVRHEYASARIAERETGVNYKAISAACNSGTGLAKGMTWGFCVKI